MNANDAIIEYFQGYALWRDHKASQLPVDPRNQRAAVALHELVEYIQGLPATDERLITLASFAHDTGKYQLLLLTETANQEASLFRFHREDETCDAFLTRFATLALESEFEPEPEPWMIDPDLR